MSELGVVAILRRQHAERTPERERWVREIRAVVPRVANCLVDEFGATRVVLFGSLVHGFAHEGSDIDLAVEGIPPNRYFRALARVAEVACRPVDIVPIEDARAEVRFIIERDGQVIRDERHRPAAAP